MIQYMHSLHSYERLLLLSARSIRIFLRWTLGSLRSPISRGYKPTCALSLLRTSTTKPKCQQKQGRPDSLEFILEPIQLIVIKSRTPSLSLNTLRFLNHKLLCFLNHKLKLLRFIKLLRPIEILSQVLRLRS